MMVVGPTFWSTRGKGTPTYPIYIDFVMDGSFYDSLDGQLSSINIYYSQVDGQEVGIDVYLHSYVENGHEFLWNVDKTGWADESTPPSHSVGVWAEFDGSGPKDIGADTFSFQLFFQQTSPPNDDVIVLTPTLNGVGYGPTITIQPGP